MTQILFNLHSSDGAEAHTLTANGWFQSEFNGFVQRRWIPDLPDFLRTRGFLKHEFSLCIQRHALSNTHADLLGVPSLRVLGDAKGTHAIAIVSRPLDPGQCAAVFQILPHLFAATHGAMLTLAPPPTPKPKTQGSVRKSIPEFATLRPWKPMLQVVGNLEETQWP